jgi:hypothetical protein
LTEDEELSETINLHFRRKTRLRILAAYPPELCLVASPSR